MHAEQIASGERFRFGENWARFLWTLNAERIELAKVSLREMLDTGSLTDKTFLDAGCGSGLFSLCAHAMGARVRSFDFDPRSVACAAELRTRYGADDSGWTIEEGSILDADFVSSLGRFDVVYSWGVLHLRATCGGRWATPLR